MLEKSATAYYQLNGRIGSVTFLYDVTKRQPRQNVGLELVKIDFNNKK